MKFDELDTKMRVFETAHDYCVLPGIYILARLDGRGFTRLTKDVHKFKAPYDERFRDYMLDTVEHIEILLTLTVIGVCEEMEKQRVKLLVLWKVY